MSASPISNRALLGWIIAGLIGWGIFNAIGAWRLNYDIRRPLIVLACMGLFLAFWGVLLWMRAQRVR